MNKTTRVVCICILGAVGCEACGESGYEVRGEVCDGAGCGRGTDKICDKMI